MRMIHALLPAALFAALAGCSSESNSTDATSAAPATSGTPASSAVAADAKPTPADADAYVAKVNADRTARYPEAAAAQWVSVTYINGDTQTLAAKANERELAQSKIEIDDAKRFEGVDGVKPETARALQLLKLSTTVPAPKDPAKLGELTRIGTKLEGAYGAGKYCKAENDCRDLGQLEDVLKSNREYAAQLDAWQGWHDTAKASRPDYARFVELSNEGAKDMGFGDTGELWRSGYDMSPTDFAAETDRLWGQVKPLYDDLQCYVRGKLEAKYGAQGSIDGMIPAHLTGNMWAQQWGNIWDLVEPYEGAAGQDVEAGLAAKQYDAKAMAQRAEDFYVSLGMPKLPESFYERSMLTQPRDRDVVCHASAWPMDLGSDVRIKMCIKPDADSFSTIYHELGHIYYYLAYQQLPVLFQGGAHDGFHEAIGDTIVLSLTPGYLNQIGLVGSPKTSDEAVINEQMRLALDKVAFLPFGLLIDRWRWGVFDGSITSANYNEAWWDLRAKYQGVAPAVARDETAFDAGAKYHVPGNTPYTRYFLAHILQFQFHKALCDAAGFKGPLHECSIYGNKEAGQRYWAMLQKGQSQPWPQTLKELTGTEQMDASAILDYFAPLHAWLKTQNEGKECGWAAGAAPVAAAPAGGA